MAEEATGRFYQLAQQRKMDLLTRDMPVPNLPIDELHEKATSAGVPEEGWEGFLRQHLPSPREEAGEAMARLNVSGHADTPLQRCAAAVAASMLGDDDVDIDRFCAAGKEFSAVIETLGAFTVVSVQQATSNINKIADAARERGAKGSLRALLQAERDAGVHGSGAEGVELKDPSAAMGVLWVARFLAFWEEVVMLSLQPDPTDGTAPDSFKESLEAAYKHTLQPYTGWVSQKSFEVALNAVPSWTVVRPKLGPPTEAGFKTAADAWIDASTALSYGLKQMLKALDLEDSRKSL